MRKIIFAIILVAFAVSSACANIFFDVFGLYNNAGYAKSQTSPGVSSPLPGILAGINVTRDFSVIVRGFKSSTVENPNKDNEKNYSFMMVAGGFEYNYPIVIYKLDQGFGWRSSVLFGFSNTEIKKKDPATLTEANAKDGGMAFEITTGIQINFIQNLAGFVDIGYHKSYYINDFEKKNIGGYQLMAGVRFYLFNFKNIGDNY